jgi:circadian clock protein KaiC
LKKVTARTPTGIPGLDEMLGGGGFPLNRVILVLGEPGAGKTILGTQFLASGIYKYGENGLFVSLEESRPHYDREMKQFGFDFTTAERERKFVFVDASPIRSIPGEVKVGKLTIGKQDFSLISLIELVRERAKTIDARRIVVDPVSLLMFQYSDFALRRKAMLDLVEGLSETGATCLLASELRRVGIEGRTLQIEEYLVHGVVLMETTNRGKTRIIQLEKMRETPIDRQPRPYTIAEGKGIEVHSKESAFMDEGA